MRQKAIREAYPELQPVSATDIASGHVLTLADIQAMALANSPAVRRRRPTWPRLTARWCRPACRPNPTVGWEADQWKPGTGPTE